MKILIASPGGALSASETRTGNRSTASQWARLLVKLGHDVSVCGQFEGAPSDLMIALHGDKTYSSIVSYQDSRPNDKIILGLAGTDIYPTPSANTLDAMKRADGIIALQPLAIEQIPKEERHKASVVLQSATPVLPPPKKEIESFDVSILGHLREVKDPLLLARASRLLPPESRIRVLQAGDILDSRYADKISEESQSNPRYRYLGQLDRASTARLIASSRVMCLTSINEGGARVIGEAIVNHTPVLSTHMDGSIGLLGADYPGYFPVGDAQALAGLLVKCETDESFLSRLIETTMLLDNNFLPEKERDALAAAIARVFET